MSGVTCVLSGGSARGGAHVGAIKALFDRGFTVDRFIGTSIGSVMGAAFASGLPYDDVLTRVARLQRREVAAISPRATLGVFARHVLRPGPWRRTLARVVPARRFADLATPLTVTAVDAETGELVLFGEGGDDSVPLIDALYASCALPVFFPAGRLNGREYLDGGLRAVLPIDVAAESPRIFAVNVGPSLRRRPAGSGRQPPGLVAVHRRAMRIMMGAAADQTVDRWAAERDRRLILVEPPVGGEHSFRVDRVAGYVEQGYRSAYGALDPWVTA